MNLVFSSKSQQGMREKLWRLPPVGFANDIETGDFEVDETVMGATDRLKTLDAVLSDRILLKQAIDKWDGSSMIPPMAGGGNLNLLLSPKK
jgi:hypothetical protein